MLIETTLLVNKTSVIQGVQDGTVRRFGGVIRETTTGRIVCHLLESPRTTNQLMAQPLSPLLKGASLVAKAVGQGMTSHKLNLIEQALPSILQMSQIAAGASVLNLGVSLAGFAYMNYKLNQIQNALDNVQKSMEAGFSRIEERLDQISGQLAYLHLLVEHSRQEQQRLGQAISELHRAVLIREMAELRAEILDRSRFPDSPMRDALRVASRVRMVMSDQALQAMPALDAQTMLIADLAIQGWAAATATEAYLLLESGQTLDAQQVLDLEIPRFREMAVHWTDILLSNERSQLATAYRFAVPRFEEHIAPERVERIAWLSSVDSPLSKEQIRRKKKDAELEFEMLHSSQYDEDWTHRQVAVAEYLDALSELSARLESLQAFAALCESQNVKSVREILPGLDAEQGLYILPTQD